MAISPVTSTSALPVSELLSQPSSGNGGAFAGVVQRLLGDASSQQLQANQAVRDLAVGQTDNLHNVMLEIAR